MHGLKIDWYLNPVFEIRRLMWTLAHAHGTLISLIQIAFAATIFLTNSHSESRLKIASALLMGSGIIMPLGFFLGGVFIYGGDPGLGIFLVPVGALMLLAAVFIAATTFTFSSVQDDELEPDKDVDAESEAEPAKKKRKRR